MSISASGERSFPSGRDNLLIQTALAGGSHGCPDALAPPELPEALDRSKRVAVRESVHGPRVAVPRPEDAPGEPLPNGSPRRDGDVHVALDLPPGWRVGRSSSTRRDADRV